MRQEALLGMGTFLISCKKKRDFGEQAGQKTALKEQSKALRRLQTECGVCGTFLIFCIGEHNSLEDDNEWKIKYSPKTWKKGDAFEPSSSPALVGEPVKG